MEARVGLRVGTGKRRQKWDAAGSRNTMLMLIVTGIELTAGVIVGVIMIRRLGDQLRIGVGSGVRLGGAATRSVSVNIHQWLLWLSMRIRMGV